MNQRIVRIADGYWRITTPEGNISGDEVDSLKCYLDEIQYPYELDEHGIAIHGSLLWSEIELGLRDFYDGFADIIPF